MSSANAMRPQVLLVDDDELVLATMESQLSNSCDVCAVSDGFQALDLLAERHFDVIVSDQVMPKMVGSELLAQIHQRWPFTERILITGYSDLTSVVKAVNDGQISYYISKPWTASGLISAVQIAYQKVLDRRVQSEMVEQACREKVAALAALEEGRQFLKELTTLQARPPIPRKTGTIHLLKRSNGEPAFIEPEP